MTVTNDWAKWLTVEPSVEEAFQLESDSRAIMEDEDHKSVSQLCAALLKQTWYQQRIIKQSIERICELEAKVITLDRPKRKSWWSWYS